MADVFNKNPSSFVDMNELFPVLNERTGLTSEQFKKVVENLIYVYNNLASGGGSGSSSGGVVFIPSVDVNGNLSWTNNGGFTNPKTVNLRGANGANGKNVLFITPIEPIEYASDILNEILNEASGDHTIDITALVDAEWVIGDNAIIPYYNSSNSVNRILGGEIIHMEQDTNLVRILLKWFTD